MKSEKEKMLTGQPYFANGSELAGERLFAKELIFDFNSLRPSEAESKKEKSWPKNIIQLYSWCFRFPQVLLRRDLTAPAIPPRRQNQRGKNHCHEQRDG